IIPVEAPRTNPGPVIGSFGCGAEPHVVVEGVRRGAVWCDRLAGAVVQVRPVFYLPDFSDGAFLNEPDDVLPVLAASLLLADLYDAVVPAGCIDDRLSFGNRVRHRLLDVNVLSRFAGIHGHQAVPVVGCADDDGIDVLLVQQGSEIPVLPGPFACQLFDLCSTLIQDCLVDVADAAADDSRLAKVVVKVPVSLVSATDQGYRYSIGGGEFFPDGTEPDGQGAGQAAWRRDVAGLWNKLSARVGHDTSGSGQSNRYEVAVTNHGVRDNLTGLRYHQLKSII